MPTKVKKSSNNLRWRKQDSRRKWLFAGVFAVLGGGVFLLLSFAATPSGTTTPLALTSGVSGKCLDVAGGKAADGNKVDSYACSGNANQYWTLTNGTIQFQSMCLAVQNNAKANGSKVVLATCDNSADQQWPTKGYELANAASGKCLDIPHAKTNGVQLDIWTCHNGANQQWHKKALNWIVSSNAVSLLSGAGASGTLTNTAFNNNYAYVLDPTVDSSSIGVPTADYKSYQDIKAAFASGALPGAYKAVLYDNEHWDGTPKAEQQNPTHYEQLVSQLVHSHHMTYISTPATDIVQASGKLVHGSAADTYISRNIAGHAAKYADVLDIQAQGQEANLKQFKSYVSQAVSQARHANSKVKILVGLSTNPNGARVTNAQLYAAYQSVWSIVNGYWLNIPQAGTSCPKCGAAQPQVAQYLLQKIYGLQ